jgi:hypothetical protein
VAYSINGKVYTDHPLMDEIIYNCKLILNGIVIKNDVLANDYEDQTTIDESSIYLKCIEGTPNFSIFPFTLDMLMEFGYDYKSAKVYMNNRDNIPEEDKDNLLEFCRNYYIDHYVEKNDYYRMLNGLPAYNKTEYYIYLDSSFFPANYKAEVDFSIPLHEQDASVLAVLDNTGKIDSLLETYRGSNYSYIRYIGDKKIDIYTARKASKWDILYIPSAESLVVDRFKELYNQNRDIYLKRTYQEAYAFSSDYYEQIMILLVLCQTFNDMIVDVPEWYIRRDIFDIRSVQYFLESYGVEFFKEIPLKYQIRIVKNLNKLIKYKSSNRNNNDILEIFALKDTAIYKYYLYKKRLVDAAGEYIGDNDDPSSYELEFVQCKLGDTYDNYIKDMIYRTPYDDITYSDKYWDGEEDHNYIKQIHLDRDFTIEGTKYMSIEYKVNLSKYLYQVQYFLGLLLDSKVDTDDIRIGCSSIQPSVYFRLGDLFLFLFLLTYGYDDNSTKIITPEDLDKDKNYVDKPTDHTFEINTERYYDWVKKYDPELFVDPGRKVFGFNTSADLDNISEVISRRHSQYQFDNGFTLEDFGVDKFIVPEKISTISELIEVYETNTECYDTLKTKIAETVDDRDEWKTASWVFDQLFTKEFDYDFYTVNSKKTRSTTYLEYLEDVLQERDYILYTTYTKIMSETNLETRKDNIRDIMNDIINTLEYYLNGEGFEYLFSFTTVSSFYSLLHYIYLMINFFKSYKVYFIDPYLTIVSDDRIENSVQPHDAINEKRIIYWKDDREFHRDSMFYEVEKELVEQAEHERIVEVVDIYGHFEPDPNDDYDYDGMYPDTDEDYKDADGGYVSDNSCYPYIMLNGGRPELSKRDLWDLNGYSPTEMDTYVDIDGGYPLHRQDYKKDYWGKAFNYIVDGGYPSTNKFYTSSMHTRVIDRTIESSVKVSLLTENSIIETKDGLYLKDNWTDWTDFENFKEDAKETYNLFQSMYGILVDNILIASDVKLLNSRIERCISGYLDGLRKVTTNMEDDVFERSLYEYTDEKIKELYEEFLGFSPFEWEEF